MSEDQSLLDQQRNKISSAATSPDDSNDINMVKKMTSWIPLKPTGSYLSAYNDMDEKDDGDILHSTRRRTCCVPASDACHFNQSVTMEFAAVSVRDHLANERTYLAWIRTSLALIGASIAILKFDNQSADDEYSLQMEGYLIGFIGIAALVTSTYRYFRVMKLLEQNKYETNVYPILVLVVVVSIAIVVAFYFHYENDVN